jgi:hypothetical protein
MWTSSDDLAWLCARVLYLALPVMAAAAVHLVVLRLDLLRGLKVPLDLGLAPRGCRLFGDNKTWRGALVMVVGSAVVMAVQQRLRAPALELFDYGAVNAWLCGALLGLGFVLGELPNSFLKRRCGVAPGGQAEGTRYWLFTALDQIDSILGGLLALALIWPPPLPVVLAALVLCSLAHVGFNLVFVWVGLKRRAL